MLSQLRKYTLLAMPIVALTGGIVSGQDNIYRVRNKSFTIGFQTGRQLLFHSLPAYNKERKTPLTIQTMMFLRKPMNEHFKVETGLKYSTTYNTATIKGLENKSVLTSKSIASIPLSLQYNFLPAKSRLNAYCGAGVQCNVYTKEKSFVPFNSSLYPDHKSVAGTRYINVLITQGITFQVNTRIQLNQSFHFLPGADTVIGFNLGIGFDLR